MNKLKVLLSLCVLCILIVSCQGRKTTQLVVEKTTQITNPSAVVTATELTPTVDSIKTKPIQHATMPVLPNNVPTPIQMSTPTQASWVIWTPNAPVSLPTAEAKVEDLLKTNGGCSLPCLWGIEPGRTYFTTVYDQLSPLTTFIALRKTSEMVTLDAEFRFPISKTGTRLELTIDFEIEDEIIQLIEMYPNKITEYRFSQILKDYGDPQEVWVEGVIDPTSNNPFIIYLYYSEKGIIATFWVDAIDLGDKLQMCPGSITRSVIVLWGLSSIENFRDITAKTNALDYINKENRSLIPLGQVTDQSLREIRESNCFNTPKEIWPVR